MGAATGLVSAHRGGAGRARENSRSALEHAATLGYDYVEFDVQVTADEQFVLLHDARITLAGRSVRVSSVSHATLVEAVGDVVTLAEAAQVLRGRTKAHVDLKLVSPPDRYAQPETTAEVAAVAQVLQHLGPDGFLVTTEHDQSVRAIREWARTHAPGLLVGLSIGRGVVRLGPLRVFWWSEVFPERRLVAAQANLVVAHKGLARLRAAKAARRLGLPLLVYTVNDDRTLRRWLDQAWLVTTDVPARALALRDPGAGRPRDAT
ncbi:MAG: glycerophosphodiester phosphodiesterase [Micrococcales bacterium]|nr:glycerophosphodiester phosphodiesterase [Micrococcales bacterium]